MSKHSTIKSFYSQIYNLAYIRRYSTIPCVRDESVAQHSFFVAALVIRLHKDYEFDLGKAVTMAIIHDWTESWLDDIMVTTKKEFKNLAKEVSMAELIIAEREFPEPILELWVDNKENESLESKIVHYADVLQCLQYAEHEIKLGNDYMLRVHDESLKRIHQIEGELVNAKKSDWECDE